MERNRNSSSVTKGRNEKHIFGSSSKRKPRSFFGFVSQVFFSPLFSLFNLTPRVIYINIHQRLGLDDAFKYVYEAFPATLATSETKNAKNVSQELTQSPQSSLIIEWKGNKEELESAPPPSPLSPSSSFPSTLAHLRRTSFVKEEEEEGNWEIVRAKPLKRKAMC